jgi:hypothetical protein
VAKTRLIVRIAAAGAAGAAALLFGVRGVAAEPPWGGTTSPDRGEASPSHVCTPNGTALLTVMRANRADDALQPSIHTCAPPGDSGSQPALLPAQPPPPALQLPPAVTVGVILPISVPALAATVTTLPPVSSEPAVPAPAAAAPPAGPAAATPASHPATSSQSAAAVLPPPPLVLRLPTVPGVNAGAAAPAALAGVVAPAMGVTGACILVGLLGSTFLVRRP